MAGLDDHTRERMVKPASPEHLRSELERFVAENKRLVKELNAALDRICDLEHTIRTLEREVAEFSVPDITADLEEIRNRRRLRQS